MSKSKRFIGRDERLRISLDRQATLLLAKADVSEKQRRKRGIRITDEEVETAKDRAKSLSIRLAERIFHKEL